MAHLRFFENVAHRPAEDQITVVKGRLSFECITGHSMEQIKRRTSCRLCAREELRLVLPLVPTPLANAYVREPSTPQQIYPLDVMLCERCGHVQLRDVVDPSILFRTYAYVSGTSPSFVRHFAEYADFVAKLVNLAPKALVVDIGSNDGTLLRAFSDRHKARVLGIDPAQNIAEAANAAGVETIAEFFSPRLAERIVRERGRAAVITANNVFAHIDDLESVTDGVRQLLAPSGLFAFEVSYLLDVVNSNLFDTIYHEHLSHHAVGPLVGFFERLGMQLVEAVNVTPQGGSLRGIVQHKGGPHKVGASVAKALDNEREAKLADPQTYVRMLDRISATGERLRGQITMLRGDGAVIAGYGAPAKATTLMYQFGIGRNDLDFIVDASPLKQGLFTPGSHIPIVARDAINERNATWLVILAWNFAREIIDQNKAFRDRGGQFIVPLPEFRIVGLSPD